MKKYFALSLSFLLSFIALAGNEPTIIPNYSEKKYQQEIARIYQHEVKCSNQPAHRIQMLSAYFLGQRYQLGALGEGKNGEFDQSPFYRTDAFDCVTYVSTVLALAHAHDVQHFIDQLQRIQYRGERIYQNRFHFIELDWNHNNQKIGYLRDVTGGICDHCQTATAIINKRAWYEGADFSRVKLIRPLDVESANNLLTRLRQLGAGAGANSRSRIMFIPVTQLFTSNGSSKTVFAREEFTKIPTPSVIEIVDPTQHQRAKIGTDLTVVHMGFAIRKNNQIIFRHASKTHHRVVDVPLAQYLAQYYLTREHPNLIGINVQLIL